MPSFLRSLFFTSFLLTLIGPTTSAQEWTRFRGPNGTGRAEGDIKNIPVQWTENDYLWKTPLPGIGHSSPVVWGDRIFLLSADPADATRYVLCLNAKNGAIEWRRGFSSKSHHLHARNSFASSTPSVDRDRLYVAWSTPEEVTFKAFDHQGNEVWSRDLGPWVSQHGFGTSPMLFDDLVILSNSQQAEQLEPGQKPGKSSMMAFDRKTGQLRWDRPLATSRACYGTPCIYRPKQGPPELICYNTADGVFSLDPKTGSRNWSIDVFRMRNVNSPIVVGDLIFGSNGSGGGGNYLVAVRAGESPQEAFRVTRHAPYATTPVAHGKLVFLFYDRGIVSCIQATDGKLVWLERLATSFSGSPVLVGERLYCIDDEGVVIVLAAKDQFQELARNPLGEPSRSTPAISEGRMFLRTNSHLICVGGTSDAP